MDETYVMTRSSLEKTFLAWYKDEIDNPDNFGTPTLETIEENSIQAADTLIRYFNMVNGFGDYYKPKEEQQND